MTKDNIKLILDCSDVYAQKLINWSSCNEKALVDLINQKLEECRKERLWLNMGLKENQPNAYDLFESDGWPLLRVLPRDDGSFYLTNLGGMAEKHFKQFVTKDELAEMKRKHKLFKQKELQHQTTIDEFLL